MKERILNMLEEDREKYMKKLEYYTGARNNTRENLISVIGYILFLEDKINKLGGIIDGR